MPMPPAPSSQAPQPPTTLIYQDTPVATMVNSALPSSEAPVTFTDIKVITDDITTEYVTLPYCDEEATPPPATIAPIEAPNMTPPAPMSTNVPAVPAPMPEPTSMPAAPSPVVPVAPAVPAPQSPSDIDSESEEAPTCTPEYITVTIYDDAPIDTVTVTEYVPYFLPVDTNMWTDLYPSPPLEPGPVVWTGAPPPAAPVVPTSMEPAIPTPPSSSHAPCPTSSWVQV
ncbi:hypothetical protein LPJ60_003585 [Coemansia sp. RSA 2675]|nr:hypothetical protein LPJ60_003585 [Coemansia sp. RSA 2675]